jgi:hypothetical protein
MGLLIFGQAVGAQTVTPGSERSVPAKVVSGTPGGAAVAVSGTQAVKQTALALQAQKLVAMAAELKASVDKTNKDILSCEVVRQAQDLEQYARQMKQNDGKK